MKVIICLVSLLIGYFAGMISCIYQVLRAEKEEDKRLQEILDEEDN